MATKRKHGGSTPKRAASRKSASTDGRHPLVAFLPRATTGLASVSAVPSLEPHRDQTLDDLRTIVKLLMDDKAKGRPARTADSIAAATGLDISLVGVDLTILMMNGSSIDGRVVMVRENPAIPPSTEPTYEILT